MQIVLLSGGSGKRLWPLSNDVRSKQFLKLLMDQDGNRQSMVQRVYAQIKQSQPNAKITIATNAAQIDSIRNQLCNNVDVVIEPQRRDTFPAVVLACAYLALEKKIDGNETTIVLPVDPFTEPGFFDAMTQLDRIINANQAEMALIGINPLLPTSKYGYIVPQQEIAPGAYSVLRFVEKPDEPTAAALIQDGAYWNGGVFAFKLDYLMQIAKANVQFANFEDLRNSYDQLDKISFDYKVVEQAKRVAVVAFSGKWTDIGTWRTLTDEMPIDTLGRVVQENTHNTFVVNELNIPIVALGTQDLVIAASPDGILVSDLTASSQLKPALGKLEQARPMYEERRWGEYTVLAQDKDSLVKQLFLLEGKSISYQSHKYRDEVWVVTKGRGEFRLNGQAQIIAAGDVVQIARNQKHGVLALSNLHITEIQLGSKFDEDDIDRFTFEKAEEAK